MLYPYVPLTAFCSLESRRPRVRSSQHLHPQPQSMTGSRLHRHSDRPNLKMRIWFRATGASGCLFRGSGGFQKIS